MKQKLENCMKEQLKRTDQLQRLLASPIREDIKVGTARKLVEQGAELFAVELSIVTDCILSAVRKRELALLQFIIEDTFGCRGITSSSGAIDVSAPEFEDGMWLRHDEIVDTPKAAMQRAVAAIICDGDLADFLETCDDEVGLPFPRSC